MPNNVNALPETGPLSLEDIANAFFLYKAYADGNTAAIDDYYGDLIKYYNPLTPRIPTQAERKINIDIFHGKRYGLPVPLTINSAVNNYNVYDQANSYTQSVYNLELNTPGIPFFITVTNNSSVGSVSQTAPTITTGVANFTTPGTYTWIVPAGITSVSVTVIGGGGGGGLGRTGQDEAGETVLFGGGGGGGGGVTFANNVPVTPGSSITVTVGRGGSGSVTFSPGDQGTNSSFLAYIAGGGGGGYAADFNSGGAGGNAGGAGGGKGGNGSGRNGGTGGSTLASPYGTGGAGGRSNAAGAWGRNGAVLIQYGITGGVAQNTQNTAAMVIGTSSDGARTFNQYTTALLVNNGSITGKADTTGVRTPNSPFVVNENQSTVQYDIAGGGGGGGSGGAVDSGGGGQGGGGQGGAGAQAKGNMPVTNGDVVSFVAGGGGGPGGSGGTGAIYKNGNTHASAGGGGAGQDRNWQTGRPSYGGGGGGGGGGGQADGWNAAERRKGQRGQNGWASVTYQPNLPGGPALFITKPTSIRQGSGGVISGGSSSIGTVGAGLAVIGRGNIIGSINGGRVNGAQV